MIPISPPPSVIVDWGQTWRRWIADLFDILNARDEVLSKSATVAYTDTTAKDLFTIPKDSQIIEIYVDVLTAFNDTGTDFLDIGKSGAANHFADNLDVSTLARLRGTSDVSQLGNYDNIGSSDVTIQGTYTGQNGNSSAGSARVTILYARGNGLS